MNLVDMTNCTEKFDDYVMVFRTLSEDRRCGDRRFLKEGELKRKIGLITFEGSGNTWVRHLIESATGIYTGSVYNDFDLLNGGFLGENLPPTSPKVAVVKSHIVSDMKTAKYLQAIIHVYRNPYHAMLAEFNRRSKGHTEAIDGEHFDTKKFNIFARKNAKKWWNITKMAIDIDLPKLLFSYESLVNNTFHYVEKMARLILGNDLNEKDLKDRLLCTRLAVTGHFKRKKKPLGFDPYSEQSKEEINTYAEALAKQLKAAGFDSMPPYHASRSLQDSGDDVMENSSKT